MREAVFLTQARHQFRNASTVGLAYEGAVGEALAAVLTQLRKFFLQKGRKTLAGAAGQVRRASLSSAEEAAEKVGKADPSRA